MPDDADEKPCAHCGEPTGPMPEDLQGLYHTPDGETVPACSLDYLHRECAELAIEAVESGHKQKTITETTA